MGNNMADSKKNTKIDTEVNEASAAVADVKAQEPATAAETPKPEITVEATKKPDDTIAATTTTKETKDGVEEAKEAKETKEKSPTPQPVESKEEEEETKEPPAESSKESSTKEPPAESSKETSTKEPPAESKESSDSPAIGDTSAMDAVTSAVVSGVEVKKGQTAPVASAPSSGLRDGDATKPISTIETQAEVKPMPYQPHQPGQYLQPTVAGLAPFPTHVAMANNPNLAAMVSPNNMRPTSMVQGLVEVGKNTDPEDLAMASGGKNNKAFFPMKLYDIVSDDKNDDIIKWLPGGKAFIIVDKKRFANEVLPLHFQQSQFTSFTRKLSRWRFTRVPRGPFIGAYYNKLFLKGHRSLCWHMRCKNENSGKMRFDAKIPDAFVNDMTGSLHPSMSMGAAQGMGMHVFPQQGFPQGMSQMSTMGAVPMQFPQQGQPGAYPGAYTAGGMNNPGLNNQILAIEGRIRELQNARSANTMMYEQQQKVILNHQGMDDMSYANQSQQARMMEARAALGMNGMVDYSAPHMVGSQGMPQQMQHQAPQQMQQQAPQQMQQQAPQQMQQQAPQQQALQHIPQGQQQNAAQASTQQLDPQQHDPQSIPPF